MQSSPAESSSASTVGPDNGRGSSLRPKLRLNKTAANTFYNIGTAGLSSAGRSILFLVGPILLEPSKFGIYAYLLWVGTVVATLGSNGPMIAAQRLTRKYGYGETRKPFVQFLTLTTLVLTSVAVAVMLFASKNLAITTSLAAAVVLLSLAGAWAALQQATSQAQHNFRAPFMGELCGQGSRLILLGVIKVLSWIAPGSFLVVDTIAFVVKSVVIGFRNMLATNPSGETDPFNGSTRKLILKTSILPVTGIAILDAILWQRGEIFFLGKFAAISSTAYYAAAAQIAQIFILAPTAAIASLMPKLAEKAVDRKILSDATNEVLTLASLCFVPLYCAASLTGPVVVHFWKPQYSTVAQILPLIMLGRLALLVSSPIALSLYAWGKERSVLIITGVSATVALTLDYILISRYGLFGAASAAVINQTLTATATVVVGHRYFRHKLLVRKSTVTILLFLLVIIFLCSFTHFRTTAMGTGLIISLLVMIEEPFIRQQIAPRLSQKAHR